jgi:hypothetical protein
MMTNDIPNYATGTLCDADTMLHQLNQFDSQNCKSKCGVKKNTKTYENLIKYLRKEVIYATVDE